MAWAITSSPTMLTTRSIFSSSTRVVVAAGFAGARAPPAGSAFSAPLPAGSAGAEASGTEAAMAPPLAPSASAASCSIGAIGGATVSAIAVMAGAEEDSTISSSQSPTTNSKTSSTCARVAAVRSVPVQPT